MSDLDYIRQVHESWLADLEGLAIQAIASNDWDAFYAHVVDFQNEHELHGVTGIAIGDETNDSNGNTRSHTYHAQNAES